jgi:hypothetical protein
MIGKKKKKIEKKGRRIRVGTNSSSQLRWMRQKIELGASMPRDGVVFRLPSAIVVDAKMARPKKSRFIMLMGLI